MKKYWSSLVILTMALAVYGYFSYEFSFTQDDAYISYRYVANYLNGHGLVYNIGERVEGFTNFGWVIYLLFLAAIGFSYIAISKATGVILGAGIVIASYLIAKEVFKGRSQLLVALVTLLVACNQSLAYWSPAGLETAAFAFLTTMSLYLFLIKSRWLLLTLVLAVLVRPEGAFLTGLLIVVEASVYRRFPKYMIGMASTALVLSLPFVLFKLFYFGSILPNPFYAKTALSISQLNSGLEYVGRFLYHYGFLGVTLILPLVLYKRLSQAALSVLLFTTIYTIYIALIGGDVLKVHRFFLPVLSGFALLCGLSLHLITNKLLPKPRHLLFALAGIAVIVLTIVLPREHVQTFNRNEIDHARHMKFLAEKMKLSDSTDFSVAISTIGIFGYELIGHDVIDLLGLTDSSVARHSGKVIDGMQSTWKEGKHNSKYVLEREPDYIVFSTGMKPSAPAEQSLLLYPRFLSSYKSVAWLYHPLKNSASSSMLPAFKLIDSAYGDMAPKYPIEWVNAYKRGLDHQAGGRFPNALEELQVAYTVSPEPLYSYLVYFMTVSHMRMKEYGVAKFMLDTLVAYDSLVYEAHRDLYQMARFDFDTTKANTHMSWLRRLVPWHAKEVEVMVDQRLTRRLQSR